MNIKELKYIKGIYKNAVLQSNKIQALRAELKERESTLKSTIENVSEDCTATIKGSKKLYKNDKLLKGKVDLLINEIEDMRKLPAIAKYEVKNTTKEKE